MPKRKFDELSTEEKDKLVEKQNERTERIEKMAKDFDRDIRKKGKTPKKKDVAKKLIHYCQQSGCTNPIHSKVSGKWYCKTHARAKRKQRQRSAKF